MECGMKGPQWASVSFGTIFCLDCSGVHRYVHAQPVTMMFRRPLTSPYHLVTDLWECTFPLSVRLPWIRGRIRSWPS
jgi:hypothetical protein